MYTAPNDVTYKLGQDSATGMIRFLAEGGGPTPKVLDGWYTSRKFADEAWNKYLTSLEKQPDKRLKQNKKEEKE